MDKLEGEVGKEREKERGQVQRERVKVWRWRQVGERRSHSGKGRCEAKKRDKIFFQQQKKAFQNFSCKFY